jgi:hypothetical protein
MVRPGSKGGSVEVWVVGGVEVVGMSVVMLDVLMKYTRG